MGKVAGAHVHLARQVAQAMTDFEFVQTVEAATAGAAVPPSAMEFKAGLLCGFARALRRVAGYERQHVSKALHYLSRTWPEYRRPVERLTEQVSDVSVAAWSDFAEAIIEANQRSDTRMSAMLEFATLVRMQGVVTEETSDTQLEALDELPGLQIPQARRVAQHQMR